MIRGLAPALLAAAAVMGATVAPDGLVGAGLGALAAGFGAAPAAIAGATAGADVGVALLNWLGLAFVVSATTGGRTELAMRVSTAVRAAWNAHGHPDSAHEIDYAAKTMASAVALRIKLILMAIVARLTAGGARAATERSAASLQQVVDELRKNRLGSGFADWIAANAQTLVRDPRLQPQAPKIEPQAPVEKAMTPSQLRREMEKGRRRVDQLRGARPLQPQPFRPKRKFSAKPLAILHPPSVGPARMHSRVGLLHRWSPRPIALGSPLLAIHLSSGRVSVKMA